MLTKKGS